ACAWRFGSERDTRDRAGRVPDGLRRVGGPESKSPSRIGRRSRADDAVLYGVADWERHGRLRENSHLSAGVFRSAPADVHPHIRSVNCRIAELQGRTAIVAAIALSVVALPTASSPADQFVKANGIRLQYVDSCFHVVDDSRRGQGASEAEANKTHLDLRGLRAPALAYFVINRTDNSRWREVFEGGYKSEQIRIFKRDVKRGRAVEFHDTDHFFFADPAKTDTVVAEIRSFLSEP